jgi:hypothetical protein
MLFGVSIFIYHFLLKILNYILVQDQKIVFIVVDNTAWQDPEEKEKNLNRLFPKLWYGWFGRGTKNSEQFMFPFKKFLKTFLKS